MKEAAEEGTREGLGELTPKEIEQELQEATKVKPKKGEDRQDYLKRMTDELPEEGDEWDDLSPDAQDWANKMLTADNTGETIPDFSSYDAAAGDDRTDEKEDEGTMQTETVTNGTGTKKPKRSAPPKPGKKAAGKKEAAPPKKKVAAPAKGKEKEATSTKPRTVKEDGVKYRIKKMMVEKSDITADEIAANLKKQGDHKPSKFTVAAIRSEFRHSLQVLRDLGWPKVKI